MPGKDVLNLGLRGAPRHARNNEKFQQQPGDGPLVHRGQCVDPAQASIDVARAKPGSERVRWICGDATTLPPMRVDLATMTANAAQQILDPQAWRETLRGAYEALRPGGRLVFETRDPARRAWEEWNREASYRVTEIPDVGAVESWVQGSRRATRWRAFATRPTDQARSSSSSRDVRRPGQPTRSPAAQIDRDSITSPIRSGGKPSQALGTDTQAPRMGCDFQS